MTERPRPILPELTVNAGASEATAQKIADRLSVWLLVGNAGGLLFCFNAVLEHRVCDWAGFQGTAILFGGGALGVILGHIFTALAHTTGIVSQKRDAMIGYGHGLDLAQARVEAKLSNVFDGMNIAFWILACLFFAAGFILLIWAPLGFILNPHAPQMLCAPAP